MKAPLWKGSLAGCVRGLVTIRALSAAYLAVTRAARRAIDTAPNSQGEDATVVPAKGIVVWFWKGTSEVDRSQAVWMVSVDRPRKGDWSWTKG